MSTGSFGQLVKNAKNVVPGFVALASNANSAFTTWRVINNRRWNLAPQDRREDVEVFSTDFQKRSSLDQKRNMWVDKELSSEVSQQQMAKLIQTTIDGWKVGHCVALPLFAVGGYAVPLMSLWLGNDTWMPSTVPQTAEDKKQWLAAQDMYRYKYAPAYLMEIRHSLEHTKVVPTEYEAGWDEVFEKNDVSRKPELCRLGADMYAQQGLRTFNAKRRDHRAMARAFGFASYPMLAQICMASRLRNFWELTWNEDYMVITEKLHEQMSDEELFDYAWRRALAPADKELSREQIMQRVTDYHTFLGPKFVEDGEAPHMMMTAAYCLGNYNDPAFLDQDIAELEKNDYEHMSNWPKDAYMRRLEFENGPLRDQVEAHTQKVLTERNQAAEVSK